MPWRAASASFSRPGGGRSIRGQSIRGQISSPIPIPDPPAADLPIQAPGGNPVAPWQGSESAPSDAEAGLRHDPAASSGGGQRQQPADAPLAVDPSRSATPGPGHRQLGAFLDATPSATRAAEARQRHPPGRALTEPALVQCEPAAEQEPRRKKSTFRSALSRLLGRRRKQSGGSPRKATSAAASSHHHRSVTPQPSRTASINELIDETQDPTGQHGPVKTIEPKRSASLPITEYDRALRSHSISPQDVLAIRSARNSVSAEAKLPGNKAAALHATATRPAAPRWTGGRRSAGLAPRPASSHDRRLRLADFSEDPDEIGRAITSDSTGLRRRSRSLSAFPVADSGIHGLVRRRSDEVRLWRESYEPAAVSPFSSSVNEAEETGALTADEPDTIVEEQPRTPVQPFVFGDMASMEAAALKITEAASLDSRISSLETRMGRLHHLVAELGKPFPGFRSAVRELDGSEDRDSLGRSSAHHSDESRIIIGDAPAYLDITPRATLLPPHPSAGRPLSLSTVRGATSAPSIPRDASGTVTADQYMNLVALLETERAARESLEAQVRRLSHQVSLATKLAGTHAHAARSDVRSFDRSLGGSSVFDHDHDDDGDGRDGRRSAGRERSRTNLTLDDSGFAVGAPDDASYTESFATPHEQGHDESALDHDDEGHDPCLRTTARALSLSRLTMGKPPSPAQQVSP